MSILDRLTRKKKGTSAAATAGQIPAAMTEEKASEKAARPARTVAASKKAISDLAANTLIAPLVTEKTAHLADEGVYAFKVPVSANRVAVRQAFVEMYGVRPVKVNIILTHGKETRFGRSLSRQSDWKKALVRVPKGTRVDVFEK